MNKHTPGPWVTGAIEPREVRTNNQRMFPICSANVEDDVSEEEARDNAILIAAAPDMFETLQTIGAILDEVDRGKITKWAVVGAKLYRGRDTIRGLIVRIES